MACLIFPFFIHLSNLLCKRSYYVICNQLLLIRQTQSNIRKNVKIVRGVYSSSNYLKKIASILQVKYLEQMHFF